MESEWKLKLTPLARTDLEEIYQYISICLDAPQAADRLMTAFEKSFEQLQNHPFSFPRADDESLRAPVFIGCSLRPYAVTVPTDRLPSGRFAFLL